MVSGSRRRLLCQRMRCWCLHRTAAMTARHGPIERPTDPTAAETRARHVLELVWRPIQDSAGRADSTADGRPDSLSHIPRRKARRVAGDECIAMAHDIHTSSQIVAVSRGIVRSARGELLAEHARESRPVVLYIAALRLHALGHATDPDVQPAILLGHIPGIAGEPLV